MAKKNAKKNAKKKGNAASTGGRTPKNSIRIQCVRTSKTCRCEGLAGYIYDCGELGDICLPIDAPSVVITGMDWSGVCRAGYCDTTRGLEFVFKVKAGGATFNVRGSMREKTPGAFAESCGCDGGCSEVRASDSVVAPVEILCVDTGVPCKHGNVEGTYWKCTEPSGASFLVCVPKNATRVRGVTRGQAMRVDAIGAKVEYENAGGARVEAETHMLCGCPTQSEYVAAARFDLTINCLPTATKCKCDGKDGYIYNCGSEGYICIPTHEDPPKRVKIQKVTDLKKKCATPACDAVGAPHTRYLLDNQELVVGSVRPKPPEDAQPS